MSSGLWRVFFRGRWFSYVPFASSVMRASKAGPLRPWEFRLSRASVEASDSAICAVDVQVQ